MSGYIPLAAASAQRVHASSGVNATREPPGLLSRYALRLLDAPFVASGYAEPAIF